MILARINEERFIELVRRSPLIAFQRVEFGYAIAASGEAYYAPLDHIGGGNLHKLTFLDLLGRAFIKRISTPALRTLRPTAKPIPTAALVNHLQIAFGESPEAMTNYDKAAGDHPAVIDSECQVVIQAIEEFERPDLKDVMIPAKRDAMSDALDLVIEHAESARELCEVGEDYKPASIRLHLMQSSTAMKSALELLLQP